MFKSKAECYDKLSKALRRIVLIGEQDKDIIKYVEEKYNIPESVSGDIIYERLEETAATRYEFLLFALTEAVAELTNSKITVEEFFTPTDIEVYHDSKYEEKKLKFPIKIDCLKIEEDQYICSIDTNFLMDLRKENLIRYNPETQRPMKKAVDGNIIRFAITLSGKAWRAIQKRFRDKQYIPNTITLNIPEDTEADFVYDKKKKELFINKIEYFDMLDGYHRYYAISQESDRDPDFNYNMVLQITNFSKWKAKDFIYQEDQKTQMSKSESQSYNMNAAENLIVESLASDPDSIWKGQISRTPGSYIRFSDLAQIIEYFYLHGKKTLTNKRRIEIRNEIISNLNTISKLNPDILDRQLKKGQLVCLFLIMTERMEDENVLNNVMEYINNVETANKVFNYPKVRKTMINKVRSMCGL